MTRHPKAGQGKKWTVKELEAIGREWKGDALSGGDGLTGEVRVNGKEPDETISISWRYGFKWQGKKAWHYCGTWPHASLSNIHEERDKARNLVKSGVDPRTNKKAERIEKQAKVEAVLAEELQRRAQATKVSAMVDAWLKDGVTRKDGNKALRREFDKDVLPAIGNIAVKDLTEANLRTVLERLLKRKAYRMLQVVHDDLVQLFRWAEQRQPWRKLMAEGNPMLLVNLSQMLPNGVTTNSIRKRVLSVDEITELRDIFTKMTKEHERREKAEPGDKQSELAPLQSENMIAVWICLGTLSRIGQLLQTRWDDIDFKLGQWNVRFETTKQSRNAEPHDHLVILSPFALALFQLLHRISGHTDWCFPGPMTEDGRSHIGVKTVTRLIGERQAIFKEVTTSSKTRKLTNDLVLAGGKNGKWTAHDLRRTGATLMQMLKIDDKIIDLCQNHVIDEPKVRKHYLQYPYFKEQEEAWRVLGDYLADVLGMKLTPGAKAESRVGALA